MSDAEKRAKIIEAFEKSRYLRELSMADRQALAARMEHQRYAVDEVVILQETEERDLYLVVDGRAVIRQGPTHVGLVRPGEPFGELEMMSPAPRAASVVAQTKLDVARLGHADYQALVDADPALAMRFVHALFGVVATRFRRFADRMGGVLRERTLPRAEVVEVRTDGELRRTPTGTPLSDILPERVGDRLVVAGLVNRRPASLTTPVTANCTAEPLTTLRWEGRRVYCNSVDLLLLEAARRVDRGLGVRMAQPVGFARRASADANTDLEPDELARRLEEQMDRLVAEDLPLREELWTVDEARAHFQVVGRPSAAELLRAWQHGTVPLVSYGEVYALRMGPLMPSTGSLGGAQVLPDDSGVLLVYGRAGRAPWAGTTADNEQRMRLTKQAQRISNHVRKMTSEHERWLETLRVKSVGEFNHACIGGNVARIIRVIEGGQEKRIGRIADDIAERGSKARVVCIAGPSSSGKTTFIKRLKVQMQVNGLRPVELSLDNYYVDREDTPKGPDGEYDFEAYEALHEELLHDHIRRLLEGERVTTAFFDFAAGKSHPADGPTIQLEEGDVLMLEGIHALNPRLIQEFPGAGVFRIFICPLATLPFDDLSTVHASDVRLLRRLVRDRHHRGYDAVATITRWPSVRAGERRHIYPFQHHADAVFDSSLVYELAVLKVYAERYLLEVPEDDPAYTTAFRLLSVLKHFVTIYPDHVPPTSILREFLGGSGFEY